MKQKADNRPAGNGGPRRKVPPAIIVCFITAAVLACFPLLTQILERREGPLSQGWLLFAVAGAIGAVGFLIPVVTA